MKTNELMIGDWVKTPIFGASKAGDIFNTGIVTEDGESVLNDEIEPIPLTEKILQKNGFGYIEKDEDITHYYIGNSHFCELGLHIGIDNKGNYWVNTDFNNIYGLKYVHELQHALRLCRIEKEIVL